MARNGMVEPASDGQAGQAASAPTKKGKLRVTLELDVRRMTRDEAGDSEPVPFLNEYEPDEIASLVAYAIKGDDAQAEMFAGSMIFVKITKVAVRDARWDAPSPTPHTRPDDKSGEVGP